MSDIPARVRRFVPARLWWWLGYHGLYQVNWRWKHWKQRHSWARCAVGHWTLVAEGSVRCWRGERCVRGSLHRGTHRMVTDWRIGDAN